MYYIIQEESLTIHSEAYIEDQYYHVPQKINAIFHLKFKKKNSQVPTGKHGFGIDGRTKSPKEKCNLINMSRTQT